MKKLLKWASQPEKLKFAALTAFYFLLSFLYLRPASSFLLSGAQDRALGDGDDMSAMPFQFGILIDKLHTHFSEFFFGALHTNQLSPPHGFLIWITWVEKILVALLHPFVTLVQIPTAIGILLLTLNALAFYGFARALSWPRWVSIGLGIAWAFNAFTRARLSIHLGLAGTFFLPLTLWALLYLMREDNRKSRIVAASLLLLTAMGPATFTLMLIFTSPFYLLFAWMMRTRKWKSFRWPDLLVVLLPVFFLLGCYLKPAPAQLMTAETVREPTATATELFMHWFAASPLDYLSSDIKHGVYDWNPLRQFINESILLNLGQGNAHEHAQGIRWSLLILAIWASVEAFRRKKAKVALNQQERSLIFFFLAFAGFAFWSSLAPDSLEWLGIRWSPFALMNRLMPQFRVPSRFSILVQFGVIAICGIYLSAWAKNLPKKRARPVMKWLPWVFSAVMILDFPPLLPVYTADVFPKLSPEELSTPTAECGTGVFIPYFSGLSREIPIYYRGLQMLRESNCRLVNQPVDGPLNQTLLRNFSLQSFQEGSGRQSSKRQLAHSLQAFAQCSGLDWIYFRKDVGDPEWGMKVCQTLHWKMVSPRFCRNPAEPNHFRNDPSCYTQL